MASAIATALYYRGANVCMVATKFHNLPQEIHTIEVQSTQEMYEYIQDNLKIAKKEIDINQIKPTFIRKKPYFFGVAAVSDYVVAYPQQGKIKKDDIGDFWDLKLKQNIDILKQLDKQDIYAIGFKAELDQTNAQQNALKMLHNKSLDAVCLNILKNSNSFGTDNTSMQLLFKDNQKSKQFVNLPKLQIALDILDTLEQNLKAEE
jgi:phosphopantothenoylcysteine decarboxylase/phosphopantothenate--cysteine ligase